MSALWSGSSCFGTLITLYTTVNPANQHKYHLLESATWTESEAEAQALGGHLVTINDAAENNWVFATFASFGGIRRDLWIGLSDAAQEGTFSWTSLETLGYQNWEPQQPDDGFGEGEHYVHMYAGGDPPHISGWQAGAWNDYLNASSYGTHDGTRQIFGVVEIPCACPADIVTGTNPEDCSASVVFSLDNCPGTMNPPCQPASGSQFPIGTTTVNCMAVDAFNNTNRCSFTVTVNDVEGPIFAFCPPDMVTNASPGRCDTLVNYPAPVADDCSGFSIECLPPSGSAFPAGTTTVNCTAEDTAGNISTCHFNVFVVEREVPRINCPGSLEFTADPGRCSKSNVMYGVTATDNCLVSIVCNPPNGGTLAVGTRTVLCTASDNAGNTTNCAFSVTVRDTQAPVLSCPNIVTNLPGGQCEMAVTYPVSALDNCTGAANPAVTCQPPTGSTFFKGTTQVSCVTSDSVGNTTNCAFTVTVNARPAGPVVLMGIDAEDGGPGGHGPIATWRRLVNNIYAQASGGSGILVIGGGKSTADFVTTFWNGIRTGITHTVTFVNTTRLATQSFAGFRMIAIASDTNNTRSGGLTLAEHNVLRDRAADIANFVNGGGGLLGFSSEFDSPAPAAGPYAYMAGLGGVTLRSQDYLDIDPTAEGLAVGVDNTLDTDFWHQWFLTYPSFLKPLAYVHLTTNAAVIGGSSVAILLTCPAPVILPCTASVSLTSQVFNAECRSVTVTWRVNGTFVQTNIVPANTPNASPILNFTYGPGLHTVTVTASDGQISHTCTTTVTVDTTPPTVLCPAGNSVVTNTEPEQCSAIVVFDVMAADNCSGTTNLTCTPPSGSRFPRGTSTVSCTVRDGAGNVANCSFSVIVNDRQRPAIACPASIVTNTIAGQCNARVSFLATATDNCSSGGMNVSCTPPSGSLFPQGITTVNCTTTDSSQNATNCAFTVTVNDTQAPSLSCPGDILAQAPPGECATIVSFTASATDNCSGAIVNCNPPSGSTFSNGTTTVACTAIDAGQNTATCSFTVRINGSFTLPALPNAVACGGQTVTFTNQAVGDGPFTYFWTLNGNPAGTNGPTLTVPTMGLNAGDHGIGVRVNGPCGFASNAAILTVGAPITTGVMSNLTRCVCDGAMFVAPITNGGPARFLWKANGRVLEGETNRILALQNLKNTNAGTYTVEMTGPCNSATNSATLTVEGSLENPLVVSNPAGITINDNPFTASPYPSKITVKCVPGILTNLIVVVRGFTHEFPDDVDIMLASPAGRGVKLMSDATGGEPLNGLTFTFDDAALNSLPDEDENPTVSGVFRVTDYEANDSLPAPAPSGPFATNLTALTGIVPNGMWSLYVFDDARGDVGGIANGWSLRLSWQPVPPGVGAPVMLPDGRFQMTVTGLVGLSYAIEASTDLRTWVPISTISLSESPFHFIDPRTGDYPQRFYRAVRCP